MPHDDHMISWIATQAIAPVNGNAHNLARAPPEKSYWTIAHHLSKFIFDNGLASGKGTNAHEESS